MVGESNTLREARIEAGKSIEEVAHAVQVSSKSIYRYETGRQAPNVYMAIRLADYYNKTVKDLFNAYASAEDENETDRSSDARRQSGC